MNKNANEVAEIMKALCRSQAVIEFDMNGIILDANDNFLDTMGYKLADIKGMHHSIFAEPGYSESSEYKLFWANLNKGKFGQGEYKRIAKGGREIWIQASYNPIFDESGKPYKVVKFATDITTQKLATANYQGQIEAISKSQAVIEFNMDGTIITANQNFLDAMGYTLSEIKGKHHSMFADPGYKESAEYKQFWENLNQGKFDSGEYKRIAKGGREIWIQASYNPIFDMNGRPFKVVKYATDITADKLRTADFQGQIEAIGKSQAVIEFNMDGTIITANQNFLDTMGYSLSEIKGKQHSMFAEPDFAGSSEYKQFWANLNRGQFDSGEYKRIAKGGREIWIQASYNPILDMNGRPFKVVKYATDITKEKQRVIREVQEMKNYQDAVMGLVSACKQGDLKKRGDLASLADSWQEVMKGNNEVIDAIVSPIVEVKTILEQMSKGDLSKKITTEYFGDHDEMKKAINHFLDVLNSILNDVANTSSNMKEEVNSLESSSMNLASITNQQSAAIEQISASVTETSKQVSLNAESAKVALQLSSDSTSIVSDSLSRMKELLTSMEEISQSSHEISTVIKVIDEIAFQTNLLALNAAVEAARAGEHGKGFAVVASEVQKLAHKCSEAAKSTGAMISKSIGMVDGGKELSHRTSESLGLIEQKTQEINEAINNISRASTEQSTAINQISVAIKEVNSGVNQCSTNTLQLNEMSNVLNQMSEKLSTAMETFQLRKEVYPKIAANDLPFKLPDGVTIEDIAKLLKRG